MVFFKQKSLCRMKTGFKWIGDLSSLHIRFYETVFFNALNPLLNPNIASLENIRLVSCAILSFCAIPLVLDLLSVRFKLPKKIRYGTCGARRILGCNVQNGDYLCSILDRFQITRRCRSAFLLKKVKRSFTCSFCSNIFSIIQFTSSNLLFPSFDKSSLHASITLIISSCTVLMCRAGNPMVNHIAKSLMRLSLFLSPQNRHHHKGHIKAYSNPKICRFQFQKTGLPAIFSLINVFLVSRCVLCR